MLAYLDTFIGFAVVMLGASLLITVLTQMVSALFSHRGANLRWGLETMFKNLPNSPLMNTATHAEMIAKDVLTHPLISDSVFSCGSAGAACGSSKAIVSAKSPTA